ncbi:hypothetical protein [uncultured Nonlabens sp.]|uniref:hypothetical protein n=1 Tax=uncultured Nonlabens sp. TaxID=859306 RepID=UPI00261F6189|nr:hypothetical protein [uncultured Nonlabens sp.]
MMRYKHMLIFMVLAFAKAEFTKAQSTEKIEKEEKITLDLIPKSMEKAVVEIGYARKKVRYYRETDGEKVSYEAKLRYRGKKYSIEFNENGILEDVEIDTHKRKISKEALLNIESVLDTMARKYLIEKIQEQYLAKHKTTTQIKENISNNKIDNYELIVAFKDKRTIYRKEMLFDKKGNLISLRDVKRLEYDFLLF